MDGYAVGGFTQDENLKTQLSSGKLFILGLPSDVDGQHGIFSQLNKKYQIDVSHGKLSVDAPLTAAYYQGLCIKSMTVSHHIITMRIKYYPLLFIENNL